MDCHHSAFHSLLRSSLCFLFTAAGFMSSNFLRSEGRNLVIGEMPLAAVCFAIRFLVAH